MHKFNRSLLRQKFNAQAQHAHRLTFLYTEIAQRMADRLDYIKLTPSTILDIGSGLDIGAKLLTEKYPKSQVYRLDFALHALQLARPRGGRISKLWQKNRHFVCGDAFHMPFAAKTMDITWSNLVLPYIDDLEAYFKEMRRVLKIGGCFLVSGLGVDSLEQLRDVGLDTYNFPDMHIIGDILVKLGFTNPVMDMEKITLEYDDFDAFLDDVRVLGIMGAVDTPKSRFVFKRQQYMQLKQQLNAAMQHGKFPLTLEVFYAHAWKDSEVLDLPAGQQAIKFIEKKV